MKALPISKPGVFAKFLQRIKTNDGIMSSYTILITKRFEKDLEICKKRGLKLSLLYTVIEQLKLNGTLPKQYRAHKLSGNYANYWECHIKAIGY